MRPPVDIPFPLSTAPGANPHEAAGRLMNVFAEPLGAASPRKAAWRRMPGLTAFAQSGSTGWREGIAANGVLYAAWSDGAHVVDAAGGGGFIAALPGDGVVTWAKNNARPTADVVAVDSSSGASVVTSSSVTPYSGGGNLPVPNSVCGQDSYLFFTIGDRRVFATENNGLGMNSQTFITAESRPGGSLLRGVAYKGLLFLFGTQWIEIWNDTAQAYPAFPYSRLSVLDRGLLSASALAGWENGFGKLLWVGDDFGVYRFDATLSPEKVSPPDLDRLIEAADPVTLRAGCFVFAGHSFWTLSSATWTWAFNTIAGVWNEMGSFDASGGLTRWRGIGGINAFGRWLVGDDQSGALATVDFNTFVDMDRSQLFRIESAAVQQFPFGQVVARADFDFSTGVGRSSAATENGTDPQVSISWNDGKGWSNPVLRPLGEAGDGEKRVWIGPSGRAGPNGRRWRLDCTDPVFVSLLGASQSVNVRAV